MKNDKKVIQTVCMDHCVYHKPGRKEELECRGYAVLERLVGSGASLAGVAVETVRKKTRENLLVDKLCVFCNFYENDCDFINNRSLPPCGGFIVLEHLLGAGRISDEDLNI